MKTREKITIGLVLCIAAAVIILMNRQQSSESTSAANASRPQRDLTAFTPVPKVQTVPTDFISDPDRVGTLRLEGQVVNKSLDGVSGVQITIDSNPPRIALSDENGAFFFEKLLGRPYRLVARSVEGAAGPVIARLSESSEPVILHLQSGFAIEVQVRRASDRTPIAGATVALRGNSQESTQTNTEGIATLQHMPVGRYELVASAPGYAPSRKFLGGVKAEGTYREQLILVAGAPVHGRVQTADGQPVPDAQVVYASVSDRFFRGRFGFDSVSTDEKGAFTIAALPPGTFRFHSNHKTFAPGESAAITIDGVSAVSDVIIEVLPGAEIQGKVLNTNGQPVSWAAIRYAPLSREFGRGNRRQTLSNEEGEFLIQGLPRKTIQLLATHDSSTSEITNVELSSTTKKRDLVLTLSNEGRIAGMVIDTNGEPVDGAQVQLRPDHGRGGPPAFSEMRLRGGSTELTDAGGHFEFGGLEQRTYALHASPPGKNSQRRGPPRRDSIRATPGETEIKIVLEAQGSITGSVAFTDGSVPASFTLSLGRRRRSSVPFLSKDGSFALEDIEPSQYALTIRGPEFSEKTLPDVEVTPGKATDLGSITVIRGRDISGHVVDAAGTPVEFASVQVGRRLRGSASLTTTSRSPFGRQQTKETTSDENGGFSISGVGESALVLIAEHPSQGRSTAVTIPSSVESTTNLELILLASGALEGSVFLGDLPAPSVRVTAQSKSASNVTFSVSTGSDGHFLFDALAPDQYLVSARIAQTGPGRGGASVSQTVEVVSGEKASVDFHETLGESVIAVSATAESGSIGFALAYLLSGELSPKTAAELTATVAQRESGSKDRKFIQDGSPARFENVSIGDYSICIIAFPADIRGRSAFDYLENNAENVPAFCASITIDGNVAESSITIPVEVPAASSPTDTD